MINLLKISVAKMQLHNILLNVRLLALALNPEGLIPYDPNSFGTSPLPAMVFWLGLNLFLQNQVGLQNQRKNMPLFFRYILSNLLRKFHGGIIWGMIPPNFNHFMREVFFVSRRKEIILPPSIPSPSPLVRRRVSSLLAPLHFRGLGRILLNAMALVGSIHPRTLLPFEPFALHKSPVPAMINFLALGLFVQIECVGQHNQTNSISLFRRYMMSKFMQNPGKLIQMMIPNYRLFMTQVFREAMRVNSLCRPGIALSIVPLFFGVIDDARQLRRFREMLRSCVKEFPYLSLELFTRQNYRVLVELYCKNGSIQYFSVTVFDQFGELVGAEAITDLKASQQTRELFVPEFIPSLIHLSNEVSNGSRSFLELGYSFNLFFNRCYGGYFNWFIDTVKISTRKPKFMV